MGNSKKDNILAFDKRIVRMNLSNNVIKKGDLDTYMNSLPDDAANAVEHRVWEEPVLDESGLTFSSITLENS